VPRENRQTDRLIRDVRKVDDRFDLIDAAAHLAEETADDVRAEAIRTGRTVRTTPKPKSPKGGKK
jgi:hypothetical protein